jgi:hypothetical protein
MGTAQLKQAPQGAVFIWVNADVSYPKQLARQLGRDDLQIVGPGWLDSYRWQGQTFPWIEVDHAAKLTGYQHELLQYALSRVSR